MALLRGAIHLKKQSIEQFSYHTILAEIADIQELDSKIWRDLWKVAREGEKLKPDELRNLMRSYVDQARALVDYLDKK